MTTEIKVRQQTVHTLHRHALLLASRPPQPSGHAAVAISDAFLTGGTIVYTEGRIRDSQLRFKAAPDDVLMNLGRLVSGREDPDDWRTGVRDYWRVTTRTGERLWLFYAHGADLSSGWFCQGAFA